MDRKRVLKLHDRATWSARDDRKIVFLWLSLIWAAMLAGFVPDLHRYFNENPPVPRIVHVHAIAYSLWLAHYTALILLVEADKVRLHRLLGWVTAGCVPFLAILGIWAQTSWQAVNLPYGGLTPAFLSVAYVDMFCLFSLIAWGVLARNNPALHRRLMILAVASIVDPGFSRFIGLYLAEPHSVLSWYFYFFGGNLLVALLMVLWDVRTGRLLKPFVLAVAGVTFLDLTASWLYFNATWQQWMIHLVRSWPRWL